jgi:uncharacterized membrane protein YqgA involved in biofilm formation
MTGTFLNILAVLVGGTLGTLVGTRLPERVRESVVWALGLFVIALGVKMTLGSSNALITLGSVLIGGLLGEWVNLQGGLHRFGGWLEGRFARSASSEGTTRFIRGFVAASLVFCVGPMTILAFSATLGVGVLFSVVIILVYQGGLTLLAAQAQSLLTEPMIAEMTAVGGLLMMAIGVGALLELRPIRVANYLPALIIAPLIVAVLNALGLDGF